MPPANRPSSPSEELAARRSWIGPTLAGGVLTPELAEFCQSGTSVVMASRGDDGRPVVGRGVACRIDGGGNVRILFRRAANVGLLRALEQGAGLAVTFTQPSTHRSIQLKATGARVFEADAPDHGAIAGQTAVLRAELVDDGYGEAFAAAYCAYVPADIGAIDFVPECAFVQTPGPSAGSALQP